MGKRINDPQTSIAATNQGFVANVYQGFLEGIYRSVETRIGWLPAYSIIIAFGLAWVAVAFQLSLDAIGYAELLFWTGLLLMVVPVTRRLVSLDATRQERLGLVILLGTGLYLVKVMHSPYAFTYPDELVHAHNVDEILSTGRLFNDNAILPVTPLYPGSEIVTASLAALTGLPVFTSGLVVVGVARLIITLGLFLFYEKISSSARLAGLASVIYMGNSNYLYWSAQFSYESVALPLMVLVLFAMAYRLQKTERISSDRLTAVMLVVVLAIVMTHHLTSYAFLAILAGLIVVAWVLAGFYPEQRVPFVGLALAATAATLFWLLFVARTTTGYLFPVVSRAFISGLELLAGMDSGRVPFQPSSSAASAAHPLWEQLIGIGSVLLILFVIPLGVLQILRRYRRAAFPVLLALMALVYFPIQGLRLTGAGWETANRASEFLFIAIGFVFAVGALHHWAARPTTRRTWVVTILVTIIFMGGLISGWDPNLRLARPYEISLETPSGQEQVIEPQGVAAARWARQKLGEGNRLATDNTNARLMMLYGDQYPLAGSARGINDLILSDNIGRGEREIVRDNELRYLVFARPRISWNKMLGLYYNPAYDLPSGMLDWIDTTAYQKFDQHESVDRILDTGLILMYDIGVLANEQE